MKQDFELHFMVRLCHLEQNFIFYPVSTKDASRGNQLGTTMFPGMLFIGYALNSGGGWTVDLIVAD